MTPQETFQAIFYNLTDFGRKIVLKALADVFARHVLSDKLDCSDDFPEEYRRGYRHAMRTAAHAIRELPNEDEDVHP